MKIVIIEDELKTARALAALITTIEPDAEIIASLQSVKSAIAWFTANSSPDLVFMDIQLADGLSFEIFREAPVNAPVVFCTAYDEYAIEGFKANGIDYILKPFSETTLTAAFQKVKNLQNHFRGYGTQNTTQSSRPEEFRHLLQQVTTPQGKNSFLVFKDNRYTVVSTDNIAFFYVKGEQPTLYTLDNKEYLVAQSLDALEPLLPAGKFFRASRQFLVHFKAVKEVEHYFSRKLLVHLIVPTPENLVISKEKGGIFLQWLDNR